MAYRIIILDYVSDGKVRLDKVRLDLVWLVWLAHSNTNNKINLLEWQYRTTTSRRRVNLNDQTNIHDYNHKPHSKTVSTTEHNSAYSDLDKI